MSKDKIRVQIDLSLDRRLPGWALLVVGAFFAIGGPAYLLASEVGVLLSFSNGTVADANAVNENFAVLADAVDDNDARLDRFTFSGTRVGLGGAPSADFDVKGSARIDGTLTAGGVVVNGYSRDDDLRILRYHATCQARFGGNYANVAAVAPPASANSLPVASRLDGTDVCRDYVGNNGRTNWTCLGVPYVYGYTRTNGWLGTDVRPTWSSCSRVFPESDGGYPWFQPGGSGPMMACCGYAE